MHVLKQCELLLVHAQFRVICRLCTDFTKLHLHMGYNLTMKESVPSFCIHFVERYDIYPVHYSDSWQQVFVQHVHCASSTQ